MPKVVVKWVREGDDNMPQFHETMYGKRFFDGQLPRLIKALQEIATNLEKQLDIPVEDAEAPGDNYEKLTIERLKEMYPILEGLGNKDITEVSIYLNLIADAHLRMATNPANTAYHVEQLGKCNQWMLQIRDIINNTDAEGEIYPCNPDVFKETHKPVEE